MFYVADRTEMQEIDRLTIEEKGVPGILLMERAAITVLEEINSRLKSINADRKLKCLVVLKAAITAGTDWLLRDFCTSREILSMSVI